MIVDVHAHGLSEDFIVEAAGDPRRGWRVEIAAPRQYIAADYGPLDSLLYDVEGRLSPIADDVGAVGAASIVLHSQFAPQMLDLPSRAGDHPWRVR